MGGRSTPYAAKGANAGVLGAGAVSAETGVGLGGIFDVVAPNRLYFSPGEKNACAKPQLRGVAARTGIPMTSKMPPNRAAFAPNGHPGDARSQLGAAQLARFCWERKRRFRPGCRNELLCRSNESVQTRRTKRASLLILDEVPSGRWLETQASYKKTRFSV